MHQQIRTSPDDKKPFRDKLESRLDKLAAAGVNIEGVAPEPNSTHILFVVADHDTAAALEALSEWGPEQVSAFTGPVTHRAGGLRAVLKVLAREGFTPNSVIVLASRSNRGEVLVSIGIDRPMTPEEWERLGGWQDTEGASAS